MLTNEGFDLWAGAYDRSVGLSDDDGTYPFAGYKAVLGEIYRRVLSSDARTVLDIGFGTGTLSVKLYARGLHISGQDFSARMIALAREKMPEAQLVQGDFSLGIDEALAQKQYDAIISTYALHHLTDAQKVSLISDLQGLLRPGGCIYIGDVAFGTRTELERCQEACGDAWDDDEVYFVYDELRAAFPSLRFEPMSHCAGLLILEG